MAEFVRKRTVVRAYQVGSDEPVPDWIEKVELSPNNIAGENLYDVYLKPEVKGKFYDYDGEVDKNNGYKYLLLPGEWVIHPEDLMPNELTDYNKTSFEKYFTPLEEFKKGFAAMLDKENSTNG